ncbi:Pvc16 family protein [Dyella choica]|nr:Pvc16 family protein [Dyella choica]
MIPSNMTIIEVNRALRDALRTYVQNDVLISFELPDPGNLPSVPTVSVFLYDVHEDLQLRVGESRAYSGGALLPAKVNVCLNYLITYWDSSQSRSADGPGGEPANQSIIVMNQVLNALINNRVLQGLPNVYTKVMPPKQDLFSLGTFWQSLGNKPRLLLNYVATVPIPLTDHNDTIEPVEVSEVRLENLTSPR